MVADSYRPSEKAKVQGLHDFVLFGSVAFGSLMSGAVYNAWGWDMLNWIIFPVTGSVPDWPCWLRLSHAPERSGIAARFRPCQRAAANSIDLIALPSKGFPAIALLCPKDGQKPNIILTFRGRFA